LYRKKGFRGYFDPVLGCFWRYRPKEALPDGAQLEPTPDNPKSAWYPLKGRKFAIFCQIYRFYHSNLFRGHFDLFWAIFGPLDGVANSNQLGTTFKVLGTSSSAEKLAILGKNCPIGSFWPFLIPLTCKLNS